MSSSAPTPGRIGRHHVRRALGLLWLLDAGLQCQPAFFHARTWTHDVAQSAMGEPPWVARVVHGAILLVSAHPAPANTAFVVAQAAFGLALLTDRLVRPGIVLSVPYAVGVWWVGEGLGVLPTGFGQLFAGAPGPALLYAVLALLAWPRRRTAAGTGTAAPGHPDDDALPGAARWVWVALWAGQALLLVPWVYPPAQVLRADLEENALDAPTWLLPAVHRVSAGVTTHPVATVVALGALQVAVGLGALAPRLRRQVLAGGLLATVAFWVIGQDFGGVLVAGGTDPGTAPLVALLGLALWPRRAPATHPVRQSHTVRHSHPVRHAPTNRSSDRGDAWEGRAARSPGPASSTSAAAPYSP